MERSNNRDSSSQEEVLGLMRPSLLLLLEAGDKKWGSSNLQPLCLLHEGPWELLWVLQGSHVLSSLQGRCSSMLMVAAAMHSRVSHNVRGMLLLPYQKQ
jgi:hypothetical protein